MTVWSLKTSSLLSVTPRNNYYDLHNSLKDDCLGDYLDADDLDDYLDKDDIEEYVEDDDRDNYLKDDDLGDFLEYNDFDDCIEALRTMIWMINLIMMIMTNISRTSPLANL